MLLEHPSAAELEENKDGNVRVVGADDEDAAEAASDTPAASSASAAAAAAGSTGDAHANTVPNSAGSSTADRAKLLQAYTHTMSFKEGTPPLLVREIGTDWFGEVFTEHAEDDTTGIQLWAASLVMARCVCPERMPTYTRIPVHSSSLHLIYLPTFFPHGRPPQMAVDTNRLSSGQVGARAGGRLRAARPQRAGLLQSEALRVASWSSPPAVSRATDSNLLLVSVLTRSNLRPFSPRRSC